MIQDSRLTKLLVTKPARKFSEKFSRPGIITLEVTKAWALNISHQTTNALLYRNGLKHFLLLRSCLPIVFLLPKSQIFCQILFLFLLYSVFICEAWLWDLGYFHYKIWITSIMWSWLPLLWDIDWLCYGTWIASAM